MKTFQPGLLCLEVCESASRKMARWAQLYSSVRKTRGGKTKGSGQPCALLLQAGGAGRGSAQKGRHHSRIACRIAHTMSDAHNNLHDIHRTNVDSSKAGVSRLISGTHEVVQQSIPVDLKPVPYQIELDATFLS